MVNSDEESETLVRIARICLLDVLRVLFFIHSVVFFRWGTFTGGCGGGERSFAALSGGIAGGGLPGSGCRFAYRFVQYQPLHAFVDMVSTERVRNCVQDDHFFAQRGSYSVGFGRSWGSGEKLNKEKHRMSEDEEPLPKIHNDT